MPSSLRSPAVPGQDVHEVSLARATRHIAKNCECPGRRIPNRSACKAMRGVRWITKISHLYLFDWQVWS